MYYFFIILESLGSLKRTVKTFKREIDSAILMYRSKDDHMFIQFFSTKSYSKDIIIKDDEHGFITGSFFLIICH